jgi:hypothetical protein
MAHARRRAASDAEQNFGALIESLAPEEWERLLDMVGAEDKRRRGRDSEENPNITRYEEPAEPEQPARDRFGGGMKRPRVPGQRLLNDEEPHTGTSREYDVYDRKKWTAQDYKLACDGRYSTDQTVNLMRHKQVAQMAREIAYARSVPVPMALDELERNKRLGSFLSRYPAAAPRLAQRHAPWSHVTEQPIKIEHI